MAQLVAHLHGMQGVRGSNPLSSTEISLTKCPVCIMGRGIFLLWDGPYPN